MGFFLLDLDMWISSTCCLSQKAMEKEKYSPESQDAQYKLTKSPRVFENMFAFFLVLKPLIGYNS